jgi:hypothetical protein
MAYKPKVLTVAEGGTGVATLGDAGVLIGNGTSVIQVTGAGTSGQVLTSNGAGVDPTFQTASSGFAPSTTLQLYDDFTWLVAQGAETFSYGSLCWATSNASGGAPGFSCRTALSNAHPGIIGNVSTASASAYIFLGASGLTKRPIMILGGGALTVNWVVNIATLSTVTNRYTLRFGLGDTTGADQANGVYFEYSDNINSGSWVGKTAAASSPSTANSAIPADTNWHNFSITVNAGATSVGFFIDGVQIANSPLTGTIPSAAISPFLDLKRDAGTVATDSVFIDAFYLSQTFTTPR